MTTLPSNLAEAQARVQELQEALADAEADVAYYESLQDPPRISDAWAWPH